MMAAADVMTRDVISVDPEAPVETVARLMIEHGISALPVIDSKGRMAGIVSEGDLVRRPELDTDRRRSWWLTLLTDGASQAERYIKTHGLLARQVMTRRVVAVAPDTSLTEIAALLEKHRIKRVPVVQDGHVVGIVSRANLVQALAAMGSLHAGSFDDRTIRDALLEAVGQEPWAAAGRVHATVHQHVAHLRGMVDSEAEREAVGLLASRTPGVRAVRNRIKVAPIPLADDE